MRIDPKASCMLGNCSITGDELHPQAQKVKLAFTKLHVPSIIFTLQVQAPLTLTKKKTKKKPSNAGIFPIYRMRKLRTL